MRYIVLLLICSLGTALPAKAAVAVEERVLQKGLFANPDCKSDLSDPGYDECQCDGDVRYPEITGLANTAAQAALNAGFKHAAEQAMCEGKPAEKAKEAKKSPSSVSHHYEVTFQSPQVLGFKFTDWAYTGGAHGNGSVEGIIVDLAKGKILSFSDLFAPKDLSAVNQVIYDTLSAKPEGEVFRDQIESRKGAFIGDGGCQGCTLTVLPDGIHVVFQTYEVASFAEGNMAVTIPAKYISYPAVTQALAAQKTTVEKK